MVTPRQLAVQAVQRLQTTAPVLRMSPASSTDATIDNFVNIPTWAWVDPAQWATLHATADVPGIAVTATAVPVRLVITYQDGIGGGAGTAREEHLNGKSR